MIECKECGERHVVTCWCGHPFHCYHCEVVHDESIVWAEWYFMNNF